MIISKKTIVILVVVFLAAALFIALKCGDRRIIVRPKVGPITDAVYALGTVKSDRWYNVRFGMSALVRKIFVEEGQDVPAGAPLLMTDSSLVFNSPFSGTVTSIAFREHEMVPAGQAVLSVHSLQKMYVRVSLDQESIVRIRKGQGAELSFENLRNETVKGLVESVFPSGSEFLVRISVDRFPPGVLPEMTCDTAIIISKKENAVMVPAASVKKGKVTLIRKGERKSQAVKTRTVDSDWVEVLENGVLPDDGILITGPAPESGKASQAKSRMAH